MIPQQRRSEACSIAGRGGARTDPASVLFPVTYVLRIAPVIIDNPCSLPSPIGYVEGKEPDRKSASCRTTDFAHWDMTFQSSLPFSANSRLDHRSSCHD